MSMMITQCPTCATTFRVTTEQLQAQQGLVRCGRCAQVFDGFDSLGTLADQQPREPLPEPQAPARDAAAMPDPQPVPEPQPTLDATRAELPAEAASAVAQPSLSDIAEIPVRKPAHAVQTKRRREWVIAASALLVLLALQLVYFWRSEIAAYVPETKPLLNAACRPFQCSLSLPQRPSAITIEASDMQAGDPLRPGLTTLTTTLHNHASVALGYPALDVVLVNARDHTVARRIFVPAEYLDDKELVGGVPAHAETIVKLYIDTGNLEAAGFRLALLTAPAR